MTSKNAPRRQRKIQEQVAHADKKHPKKEDTRAMQAGARAYPAPALPASNIRASRDRRLTSIPLRYTMHLFTLAPGNWRTRWRSLLAAIPG